MDINKIVKEHTVKKASVKNCVSAFISGGLIGAFGQFLLEFYQSLFDLSEANSVALMVISIIFITAILTGLCLYDKMAQKCGAGVFIPISGFANALTSCALEGKTEGLIFGIGSNMFKLAGSVLTYGISTAYLLGIVRYFFNI